jgi:sec-independent protein translocase protein TatC
VDERSDQLPPDDEVEGGAVKSFLEHLEDLRWMLVKIGAATLLAMMVCLFGVKQIVAILQWPLKRAAQRHVLFMPAPTNQLLTVELGGVTLQTITVLSNHVAFFDVGTNLYTTAQLNPVRLGSNVFLEMRVITNDSAPELAMPKLVFMDPSAPFLAMMHLAFFAGLIMASPFVLYFVAEFVMPALKIVEKKYFLRAFYFGTVLFLAGVSFAYFVVLPPALKFAQLCGQLMGVEVPFWRAEDYFGFEIKFMLGMGLGFELPVVLLALVKIGLLDYAKLSAMRRYMVVGNLILGALLTTPEVFTQIAMAVALQLLFEVAVWIAWYWERQEKKRAAAAVIDV